MQAVLYTHQLEPITVVDIPMWLWERLAQGQTISLAAREPVSFEDSPCYRPIRKVDIFGELMRRRGHETLMLFTSDEENALLLKSEFLPGQRGELQLRERSAFAKGFMKALQNFSE